MKRRINKFATRVLLPAMIALTSCSSEPKKETSEAAPPQPNVVTETVVAAQKGVPGGIILETYQTTATVSAIDATTRKVTLTSPNGTKTTVKAGPEVRNFDQIQVGDQLRVTVAEELVVFLRKKGEPPIDGESAAVAVATKGEKPAAFMADTVEVTATVTALDLDHHKATLLFPGGDSRTVSVRPDVDMTRAKLGDEVVIRTTEALAISVDKL